MGMSGEPGPEPVDPMGFPGGGVDLHEPVGLHDRQRAFRDNQVIRRNVPQNEHLAANQIAPLPLSVEENSDCDYLGSASKAFDRITERI
jgi:hypothetical protein